MSLPDRDPAAERRHLLTWLEAVAVFAAIVVAIVVVGAGLLVLALRGEVERNHDDTVKNRAVLCTAVARIDGARIPTPCFDTDVLAYYDDGRP